MRRQKYTTWDKPATINDNASGVHAERIGEQVVIIEPGLNHCHCLIRNADGKCEWLPTRWLTISATETGLRDDLT